MAKAKKRVVRVKRKTAKSVAKKPALKRKSILERLSEAARNVVKKKSSKKGYKKPTKKVSKKKVTKKKATKKKSNPITVLSNPITVLPNPVKKKKVAKKTTKKVAKKTAKKVTKKVSKKKPTKKVTKKVVKKVSKKKPTKKVTKKVAKKVSKKKVTKKKAKVVQSQASLTTKQARRARKKARKAARKARKMSRKLKTKKNPTYKASGKGKSFKKKKHKLKGNPVMKAKKFGGEMIKKIGAGHTVAEAAGLLGGGAGIQLIKQMVVPRIAEMASKIPFIGAPIAKNLDYIAPIAIGALAHHYAKNPHIKAAAKGLVGAAVVTIGADLYGKMLAKPMAGIIGVPNMNGIIGVPNMNGFAGADFGRMEADFGQIKNSSDFGSFVVGQTEPLESNADFTSEATIGAYSYEDGSEEVDF